MKIGFIEIVAAICLVAIFWCMILIGANVWFISPTIIFAMIGGRAMYISDRRDKKLKRK